MFYPEIKPHISPSAHQAWHENKSGFINSYFKGIKSPETGAMRTGTKIHGLIEAGFLKAQRRFKNNEVELVKDFRDTGVKVLGKPDSFGLEEGDDAGYFLDYKSGREVSWTREDLAKDIKMRTTAWLVWQELGKPEKVYGYIAWIGTEWNGTEVVPVEDEYLMIKYCYTFAELTTFEDVIAKSINDINSAYERFLNGTNLVDEELCKRYADLDEQVKAIEAREIEPLKVQMDEIKEMISEQMQLGDIPSHETPFGTFSWRTTKKYEYPEDLEFQTESAGLMTLALGEEIAMALSATKKNYELGHDPVEEKKSLSFRAKKKK